jgi:cytochrome c biogenesis factor
MLWHLDLSYVYVADHARREIGSGYRLAGLWGGADGSLLMFTAFVAVAVAAVRDVAPAAARWGAGTIALLATTSIWFADPFERLRIPAIDGGGLQPILEHPARDRHKGHKNRSKGQYMGEGTLKQCGRQCNKYFTAAKGRKQHKAV